MPSPTPEELDRYQAALTRFSAISAALSSGVTGTLNQAGQKASTGAEQSSSSTGSKRLTREQIDEQIIRCAFGERSGEAPPLTTYRTTSGEHGQIYQASREFVDWLRRKVDGYGECCPRPGPTAGGSAPGEGITF